MERDVGRVREIPACCVSLFWPRSWLGRDGQDWRTQSRKKRRSAVPAMASRACPEDPTTPIIWGQHSGYLYVQLREFQKGARKDDRMTPIAASL